MPNAFPYEVFLSHSTKDGDVVRPRVERLQVAMHKRSPDVLKVPPVSDHEQIGDFVKVFRGAVNELQVLLYAA